MPTPSQTRLTKLMGQGLGTGMGLDKAKSLLEVTGGNTFLDLIAKQAPGALLGNGFLFTNTSRLQAIFSLDHRASLFMF